MQSSRHQCLCMFIHVYAYATLGSNLHENLSFKYENLCLVLTLEFLSSYKTYSLKPQEVSDECIHNQSWRANPLAKHLRPIFRTRKILHYTLACMYVYVTCVRIHTRTKDMHACIFTWSNRNVAARDVRFFDPHFHAHKHACARWNASNYVSETCTNMYTKTIGLLHSQSTASSSIC